MVMKKIYFIVLFLTLSMAVTAQEKGLLRKGFNVGAAYTSVKSKASWATTSNTIGLYGEYEHPLVKKIGLSGMASIGFDKLQGCAPCETGWYQEAFWWGLALKRPFQIESQKFSIQVRGRWFGFGSERVMPTSQNPVTGKFDSWTTNRLNANVWGLRLGYQIPVSYPLEFNMSHEWNGIFRLNTVGLAWQF
ncbi:hypothetical protein SAMN00777080_2186 [Aquiflexum balticum DSM 16537]|uniref:Outer membrane protein beta-barrel domain-containing protein n=2 Tax=Aquiflexum TaxID=280472 RepID=A0A1W2H3R5_9BACT|nr:hypothetical protein SAMN00777080_2186 [Aquiflexum balticum DSM 16537]